MRQENNFEAVRILAAAAVIYGHAHPITAMPGVSFWGNSIGSFAVKVFFVISGYLVAASLASDPHVPRYLAKRALRIFPALILVTVLSALVLGPLLTTLPLHEYFGDTTTWNYIVYNVALHPLYALPGVFVQNPYQIVVNGSLWSLPAEFLMYLIFPVLYWLGRWTKTNWLLIVFTVSACVVSAYFLRIAIRPLPVVYGTGVTSILDCGPYFFLGALYSRTRLRRLLEPGVAVFVIGILLFLQPKTALVMEICLFVALPYCVLSFSTASSPLLSRAGRWGDPSYGIYLFGWPVQQVVCHLVPNVSAIGNTLASLPVVVVLAYASWHIVEKRALAWKPHRRAQNPLPATALAHSG